MAEHFSLFTSLRFDEDLAQVPHQGHEFDHAGWNYTNESNLYMLDYHRDRLLQAATHWQWQPAIDLLSGDEALASLSSKATECVGTSKGPLRLRIVVSSDGEMDFEKFNTPKKPLENLLPRRLPPPGADSELNDPKEALPCTLLLDSVEVERSEYTHFKTTKRTVYDFARQRTGISPTDNKEVLLVNQDNKTVMEGSISTPYFWRNGRWVTPPVSNKFSWKDGSGGQDGTSRRWALERGLAIEEAVDVASVVDGEGCWISNGARGFTFAIVELPKAV